MNILCRVLNDSLLDIGSVQITLGENAITLKIDKFQDELRQNNLEALAILL